MLQDLINIGAKMKAAPKKDHVRTDIGFGSGRGEGFPDLSSNMLRNMNTPAWGKWGTFRARYRTSVPDFARDLRALVLYSTGTRVGETMPRVADRTGRL